MSGHRTVFQICLFVACASWSCTELRPSTQDAAMPLFMPNADDTARLTLLTHELDEKARQCIEPSNCEQVYFARALVSLFESREAARASFHRVIERNPDGPLVSSSQLWLQIIDDQHGAAATETPSGPWRQVVAQLLRDWMERQVSGQALLDGSSARGAAGFQPPAVREQPMDQSRAIKGMHKQLRERDRQIAALRSQLEALKYIDQENVEKQRKVKPPASLRMTDHFPGP